MSGRRGGIPGPESRTGLVRPAMSEAEFERLAHAVVLSGNGADSENADPETTADEIEPAAVVTRSAAPNTATATSSASRNSRQRAKAPAKARRVQRMFAIEEELDKKLWLYAIHLGKDRSEVINDLLRPVVASMVLYDSRDRRNAAANRNAPEIIAETIEG